KGKVSQSTMPLPAASSGNGGSFAGRSTPTSPSAASNPPSQPPLSAATEAVSPARTPGANHTDKIRAVIYPNQRSWSTQREAEGQNTLNSVNSQNSMSVNAVS